MTEIRSYRWMMAALGAVLGAHLLGMLLSCWVTPVLDLSLTTAARAEHVAGSPWLYRLGWLPWHLAAVANVWFGAALLNHLRTRRAAAGIVRWAMAGAVLAALAAGTDLYGQWLYTSIAPPLTGDLAAFAIVDAEAADLCSTRANVLYVAMGWCWLMASASLMGGWMRNTSYFALGVIPLGMFAWMSAGNAKALASLGEDGSSTVGDVWELGPAAFVLYVGWLLALAVHLGRDHHRRHRAPDDMHHRFSWPAASRFEFLGLTLAEPGLRDVLRPLSRLKPTLRSDVTEVAYVNWLVPVERVRHVLPPSLEPHVDGTGHTVVTLLSYHHGHWGPEFLGRARRIFGSPRQFNVRLYLAPEHQGGPQDSIWFLRTALDSPLYTPLARLFADGLPAHLTAEAEHRRDGEGWWTHVAPGFGGAPPLRVRLKELRFPGVPEGWRQRYREWEDLVWDLADVNRGVRPLPALGGYAETRFSVKFDLDEVLPAKLDSFESELLDPIVRGCPSVAFVLPQATFRVEKEQIVIDG